VPTLPQNKTLAVAGDGGEMREVWMSILGYVSVGILWGCSNPFIKQAQAESQQPGGSESAAPSMFESLKAFITNPRILFPYFVNQSGSLVYYYLLSSEPMSRAGPICNSLTFLFTALTGYFFFHEEVRNPGLLFLGVAIVVAGVIVSML
jgi:drug/metabolite transporter (DMT)-like permease